MNERHTMRNKKSISFLLGLTLSTANISPIYAGTDDGDGGEQDNDFTDFIVPYPIIFPDFDAHRGRKLVQLPGTDIPDQCQIQQDQCQKLDAGQTVDVEGDTLEPFPHVRKKALKPDPHGRQVITLDHGNVANPFMIYDEGHHHVGLLLGVGAVEPHSSVGVNILSKWQRTKGSWAQRLGPNYTEAKDMKRGKTPKKASHFDKWQLGDSMRKTGIAGLTLYGGLSVASADARAGGFLRGIWARNIQKMSANLIRVTFTREREEGPLTRLQVLPLEKSEMRKTHNQELSRVYLFDLNNDKERKALERLLKKNILPAENSVQNIADEGEATLLTSRNIKRQKVSKTPFQAGIPFIVRYRTTRHIDKPSTVILNHRNGHETKSKSKAYLKQSNHRYINAKKPNGDKRRRYFTHTHQHYNRAYAGTAVSGFNHSQKDLSRDGYLHVQVSFSHDNPKVKKVNKYLNTFWRKIGIKDFVIDTNYEENARIGYVELNYNLKVGPEALAKLSSVTQSNKDVFKGVATMLMDDYFNNQKDPFKLCDSSHDSLKKRCIVNERERTLESLKNVHKYINKLNKDKVKNSSSSMANYLAKIARELSTNHFVLHTFITSLPENPNGYSKLEIFGERFLGKRFNVDPNKTQGVDESVADSVEEELYTVDWDKDNLANEGNEIF